RAGLLVEPGPALDPDRLGHRDLYVVDELAVPDRLQDPLCGPGGHGVFYPLLFPGVVDAGDLPPRAVVLPQGGWVAPGAPGTAARRSVASTPRRAAPRPPFARAGRTRPAGRRSSRGGSRVSRAPRRPRRAARRGAPPRTHPRPGRA